MSEPIMSRGEEEERGPSDPGHSCGEGRLAAFAKEVIRAGWNAWVDEKFIHRSSLAHGLVCETTYDPVLHGPNDVDAEAGDPWFVFDGPLIAPGIEPNTATTEGRGPKDESLIGKPSLREAQAVQRQALAFRLQCRLDAMAERGMESVGISKGFAAELMQALIDPREAAEEAAYEELDAIGARVQQGWDADESVFDAARLRWLEKQARKSLTGISFDWVPPVEGERSGFRFMRRFFVTDQCDTLKAAIDRAMLDDPEHVSDRCVYPAAEGARLVAALIGETPAQCDGSPAGGETAQAGSIRQDDSTAREAGAPIHTPTPQETARESD